MKYSVDQYLTFAHLTVADQGATEQKRGGAVVWISVDEGRERVYHFLIFAQAHLAIGQKQNRVGTFGSLLRKNGDESRKLTGSFREQSSLVVCQTQIEPNRLVTSIERQRLLILLDRVLVPSQPRVRGA